MNRQVDRLLLYSLLELDSLLILRYIFGALTAFVDIFLTVQTRSDIFLNWLVSLFRAMAGTPRRAASPRPTPPQRAVVKLWWHPSDHNNRR